jgi:protein-S-isoprenylcysteine O-methyltransferase Ste14
MSIPSFTVWSLWIMLLGFGAAAWLVMILGDRLRGTKIENEDHLDLRTAAVRLPPLAALFAIAVFTPIAPGPLFWVGAGLAGGSFLLYVLAIAAFVKARGGVTTIGIYRVSRNPMYLAMIILLAAVALMALSASALMGLVTAVVAVWYLPVTHWSVRQEERYLEQRFGDSYRSYMRRVPRYLLFL